MKALAAAEGLPWGERTMTYNSRLAQEMGAWAESKGKGTAWNAALFRAYFGRGANIAAREVLVQTAEEVGLDADEAAELLDQRSFRAVVDADWAQSMRAEIQMVPTFVVGEQIAEGAEPYEVLEKLLIAAGARRRAP